MFLTFKLLFFPLCPFRNIPVRLDVGTQHCRTLEKLVPRHAAEQGLNQDTGRQELRSIPPPTRFPAGLVIGTAVAQYRIHVTEKLIHARGSILKVD